MPTIVLDVNAGDPLTFTGAVPVGSTLVILLGDGDGHNEKLTAATDTAGNAYTVATDLGYYADGDGTVNAASTITTHPIAPGDTFEPVFQSGGGVFHTYGIVFSGSRTINRAVQHGLFANGTITINESVDAGELAVAFAAFQDQIVRDPGNGWIDIVDAGGDSPNNLMCVAYQEPSTATLTYQPSRPSGPGGDYAAAAILVLGAPPPPPTVTGVSPASGIEFGGTSVTITGTGFADATAVSFGTVAVTRFVSQTATEIVLISPTHPPGSVDVIVTAASTSAPTGTDRFTFIRAPYVPGEAAFTPLTEWAVGSGWLAPGTGYLEHDGSVYLEGALYNRPRYPSDSPPYVPVTAILLTIPEGWRPAETVTISVPVWVVASPDRELDVADQIGDAIVLDIGTPPWNPPALIDVTIGTDGTVTLAELPPAINEPPMRGSEPFQTMQYGNPSAPYPQEFCYQIPLGGLTWRIAPAVSHAIDWQSLAPYLGDNFEDINSQYAIDHARLMLRGRVRAKKNGAGYGQPLLQSLPPDSTSLLDQNENYFSVELEARPGDERATTYTCRVSLGIYLGLGGGSYFNGNVILLDDTQYLASFGGVRRLVVAPPSFALPLNADDVVPWGHPFRPVVLPSFNYYGEFFTLDADFNILGYNGNYSSSDTPGFSTIAGLAINPRSWPQSVQSAFGNPGVPWTARASATDRTAGLDHFDLSATISIADLIANLDPAPDWVAIAVGAEADVETGFWGGPGTPVSFVNATVSVSGVPRDNFRNPVDLGFGGSQDASGFTGASYQGESAAWVTPSGGSTYDADPHNPYTDYLWKPDEAPVEASINASGAYEYGFPFGGGAGCSIAVAVFPFYEIGKNWILGGDVITLDGGGWQTPFRQGTPELLIPGSLLAGPGSVGRIPWLRSAGRAGADTTLGAPGGAHVAPQYGGEGGSAGVVRLP